MADSGRSGGTKEFSKCEDRDQKPCNQSRIMLAHPTERRNRRENIRGDLCPGESFIEPKQASRTLSLLNGFTAVSFKNRGRKC